MMRPLIVGVALTVLLASSLLVYSQQIGDAPKLQVRTTAGQTTFRIGERIPLELAFTGPENKRYEVTASAYDRSGRGSYERFEVSPDRGWADPLKTYFNAGHVGGGLSGSNALSVKPVVVSIDLNEWVRFDQPGVYHVIIMSHRVSDTRVARGSFGGGGIELRSKPLELSIIPASKAWQEAQLASILSTLEREPEFQGLQADRRAAIANLRFLGTAEAARVMAKHVRSDEPSMESQCAFGLMGLREAVRPEAVAALRTMMEDPDFPITDWMLITYDMLQLSDDSDVQTVMKYRASSESEALKLAVSVLASKREAARAITAQTIQNRPQLTAEMKSTVADDLRSDFAELPIDRQVAQLQSGWDKIRSRELLPALKQDAEITRDDPRAKGQLSWVRDLKEAAYLRWYELDPDGARRSLSSQIGSANPSLGPESLSFLPEQQLPQYEHVWADSFAITSDFEMETRLAALMTRFGTGSELALVRDKAERLVGKWACAPQGAALAYLVKFDPASARPLVDRALAARGPGKTACNRSLFQDIARWATDPILTEAAISTLNDPDIQVANDAVIYLMSYDDQSAEKPIWDRYVAWSEHWRGRESELEKREAGSPGKWDEIGMGENLARALIASQGWLADDALISRVLELCVARPVCEQLRWITDRQQVGTFGVSAYRSGAMQIFQIAQYTPKSLELLEAKISQFPPGSKFVLVPLMGNEDERRLQDQVKPLFQKHGMFLQNK